MNKLNEEQEKAIKQKSQENSLRLIKKIKNTPDGKNLDKWEPWQLQPEANYYNFNRRLNE